MSSEYEMQEVIKIKLTKTFAYASILVSSIFLL